MKPLPFTLRKPFFLWPRLKPLIGIKRANRFLIFLHGPKCAPCQQTATQLLEHASLWRSWGVQDLLLFKEPLYDANIPIPQAAGFATEELGLQQNEVAFLFLDFRGCYMGGWVIKHEGEKENKPTRRNAPLTPMDWGELEQTARWVATQEPECGTCSVDPLWEEAFREP